jgi:hypothetical protein
MGQVVAIEPGFDRRFAELGFGPEPQNGGGQDVGAGMPMRSVQPFCSGHPMSCGQYP